MLNDHHAAKTVILDSVLQVRLWHMRGEGCYRATLTDTRHASAKDDFVEEPPL